MQRHRRNTYTHPHIFFVLAAAFFLIFLLASIAVVTVISPGKTKESGLIDAESPFDVILEKPDKVEEDSPAEVQGVQTDRASFGIACLESISCANSKDGRCAASIRGEDTYTYWIPALDDFQNTLGVDDEGNAEELYIAECRIAGESYSCTTGSEQLDISLFGVNNIPAKEYKLALYEQRGATSSAVQNGFTIDERVGSLHVASTKDDSGADRFLAVVYPRNLTSEFTSSAGTPTCAIHTEVSPRAFDSYTLEPLENTPVRMLPTDPIDETVLATQYILSAEKEGYRRLSDASRLHPASRFMYENIYLGNQPVSEIEYNRYSVPLEPLDKQAAETYAATNKPRVLHYFQSYHPDSEEYVIQGSVTHPGAAVAVKAQVPNVRSEGALVKTRTLAHTTANVNGYFEVRIRDSVLKKNEVIGELIVAKRHIRGAENMDATEVDIPALLRKLSGRAQDLNGHIIPGARVAVYLPFSEKAVYEAVADEKGMYSIDTHFLPVYPYTVKYITLSGESIPVSTDTFFAQQNNGKPAYVALRGSSVPDVLGASDSFDQDAMLILVAAISCFVGFLVVLSIILSYSQLKKIHS